MMGLIWRGPIWGFKDFKSRMKRSTAKTNNFARTNDGETLNHFIGNYILDNLKFNWFRICHGFLSTFSLNAIKMHGDKAEQIHFWAYLEAAARTKARLQLNCLQCFFNLVMNRASTVFLTKGLFIPSIHTSAFDFSILGLNQALYGGGLSSQ